MDKVHTGLTKKVKEIILGNPDKLFCAQDIATGLNLGSKMHAISLVMFRLFNQGKLNRTPTQLDKGYYYTSGKNEIITNLYNKYLLPYKFENREELILSITKKSFKLLDNNAEMNIDLIKDNKFVKKYGIEYFKEKSTQEFLAMLVGFCMCDGHVRKNLEQVQFFFRYKKDAEKFYMDFKKIFYKEYLKLRFYGCCYRISICGKALACLLNNLGAPSGNKICQSFVVPYWILFGKEDIKKKYLRIVIGNEGSAPSDNRWRIQFVLSKRKEHVPNLIEFQNQIRRMLFHFGITTSHIQLRKQEERQFHGRFYIKGKENLHKFYNLLEFSYASEKQEVLERLILEGNSFRSESVRG